MSWVVKIAEDAELFIQSLPKKTRRQVSRSIDQLEEDPFQGDVKPLEGKAWRGYYRKRTGNYRIIFLVHHEQRLVDVSQVSLRSEKTYRSFAGGFLSTRKICTDDSPTPRGTTSLSDAVAFDAERPPEIWASDHRNVLVGLQVQKVMVIGDNQVRLTGNGAFQNPVIIRIGGDDIKLNARNNDLRQLSYHQDGFVHTLVLPL